MTFAKADKISEKARQDEEEYKKLMCSVTGCKNRWSVHIDSPRCSFHQWQSSKKPSEKTIKAWYMENEQ